MEEQRQLQTIITSDVKNERRRNKRRDENGLMARERTLRENMDNVSELLEQGLKQKEIAEKLGLTKGRVSQLVKEIKKV